MAFDVSEINRRINALFSGIKAQALAVIKTEAVKSVLKNFEMGGRPKWEPSVKKGKLKGTKTLVVTGKLSNVSAEIAGDMVILKTAPEARAYAKIHQEGGTIEMPSREVRHRKVTAGRNKGKTVFASSRSKKAKPSMTKPYKINIPARPYLVIPPEDIPKILKAVETAISKKL